MTNGKRISGALRHCATVRDCSGCDYGCDTNGLPRNRDLLNDAADAIEELFGIVLTYEAANDMFNPQWASVEERLPKDSGYTIVFCADGDRRHVTFAKYLKTPKRWELNGARSYWRVLKWMPLPEPPKEVQDG